MDSRTGTEVRSRVDEKVVRAEFNEVQFAELKDKLGDAHLIIRETRINDASYGRTGGRLSVYRV